MIPVEKRSSTKALLWTNFFLADIRDGLGPYIAIYLRTEHNWNAAQVGITLTVMSATTLMAQAPMGAMIDSTRFKRAFLVVAAVAIAVSSLVILLFPFFWTVTAAKIIMGLATAVIPPAIAGITLGLMGRRLFSMQVAATRQPTTEAMFVQPWLPGD